MKLKEQLASWDHLSAEHQQALFFSWVDDMIGQLTKAAEDSTHYSEIIYIIQTRTNVLLNFAFDTEDIGLLVRLSQLYMVPLDHLSRVKPVKGFGANGPPLTTWVDPDDGIRPLTSSQFLYLIAYFIRRVEELERSKRPSIFERLASSYAPILRDHLDRWIFGEPGLFGVPQECRGEALYTHSFFIKKRRAREFGKNGYSPSYCNALRDLDLWIIATAAETVAAAEKNAIFSAALSYESAELRDYRSYIEEGAIFFLERLEIAAVDGIDGQALTGLNFDSTSWLERSDHRYSGYAGTLFPEDNASTPTRNPSFENNFDHFWQISGEGNVSAVTAPVLTGRTARRLEVGKDQTIGVSQVLTSQTRGRVLAYFHKHLNGDADVRATLFIDGARARTLEPASDQVDGWERLETIWEPAGLAYSARLDISVSGPGTVILDEARIVPIDETAAARPSVAVPPVVASGSWDISHARRLVQLLETFDSLQLIPRPWTADELKAALARQIAYVVFNGDLIRPGFANYLDGTDGWYRVNYANRIGFGYAPGQLSSAIIDGGYCKLAAHDSRLMEICSVLWSRMKMDLNISPDLTYCHTANFIAVRCTSLSERAISLVASMNLLPPALALDVRESD